MIGQTPGYSVWDYTGRLDRLRLWNAARTREEIQCTIDREITAAEFSAFPSLVASWNFEGNALDESGAHAGSVGGDASFTGASDIPTLTSDCNANGQPDACDIASGASSDIDVDGVPDECEPAIYCTAKFNSLLCLPAINFQGLPSASNGMPFAIGATNVISHRLGLLFYGLQGRANVPFQDGTLCAQGPVRRTPIQSSGGNPPPSDCSGAFTIDFNGHIASGVDASLVAGTQVNAQYWYRDPQSSTTTGLSDAVEFTIGD